MTNKYIGHENQIYGVEEYRLQGTKGDGMRFLSVRNGKGLEFQISLDRCGDLSRVTFKGDNMGYFAPCGYVHPSYYDKDGTGFLKSFTAGFLTTCGLWAVEALAPMMEKYFLYTEQFQILLVKNTAIMKKTETYILSLR